MSIGDSVSTGTLSADQIRAVIAKAADALKPDGQRLVVLIPDLTRSGPTDQLTQMLADAIAPRAKQLDFLIALGTHQGLGDEQIGQLTGRTPQQWTEVHSNVRVLNHEWDNPDALKRVGTFSAETVAEHTNGMLSEEIAKKVSPTA